MKDYLRNKPVGFVLFLILMAWMISYLKGNWQAYNEQTTFQPVLGEIEQVERATEAVEDRKSVV